MELLKLNEMSVEQKIGMLLIARGFRGEDDRKFIFEMLKKKSVGGIQVAARPGCEDEIKRIQDAAGYPLLICADMETGFPMSRHHIPAMMSLAATDNEALAYEFGCITAIEAKKAGYNTIWGPVVDIIRHSVRTFGADPDRVARFGAAVARGYWDNGIFFTAKHFPGGRDVLVDTHMVDGESHLSEADIRSIDMRPYEKMLREGILTGVMTKHVVLPQIDPVYPATLSKAQIDILRSTGFDGVVMTDSFAMMGILQKFSEETVYGTAVQAGNDMILPNYRISFRQAYDYLMRAYETGVITPERLDEAIRRILVAQEFTLKPATQTELTEENKNCVRRIREESICAVTDEGVSAALPAGKKRLFVVLYENLYREEGGAEYEIVLPGGVAEKDLAGIREEILARFPGSEVLPINLYPSRRQTEKVCYASTQADEVIFITYTMFAAYMASSDLSDRVIRIMESMEQRIAAIVHVGTPCAIEATPHVPRRLFAFGGDGNIPLMLDVLAGKMEAKGSMPVELQLK